MPERPPVIAHLLHRLELAGAEVLAADIARQMRDRFSFLFLCLDGIGELGQRLANEGFPVLSLDRKPGVDWNVTHKLSKLYREHRVRLVHAHQYSPFFYATSARGFDSSPKILFTEHGRHYPDQRKFKHILANRFLLGRQDRVIAVGQFVRRALHQFEGIPEDRVDVIYNGVDPTRFRVNRNWRHPTREQLGIPHDQLVVLQVARFHPVKDHPTALHAFAQTLEQVPDALLLLVGDGELRPDLEHLAHSIGLSSHIRFLGQRSDIPQLMAASDVFMLSSLSEGISVTLLEAMGCELPVAATDVGGNSEVVEHEVTGLLSPREDAPALASHLIRLLRETELRLKMGQAGRQRLLSLFTQQVMHERYSVLYTQMLG